MLAIIADVHGNLPALEAVLADSIGYGCTRIVSLGDVGGYYSQVNECIDLLLRANVPNVMGNHDYYLISGTGCPRSHSASLCLDYQRRILTQKSFDYLRGSVEQMTEGDLNLVHGGWKDPRDEYLYKVSRSYFADRAGRFFLSGHTHVQCLADFGDKVYCNPGSVGQPRDGDPRAAYAILRNGGIELRRVPYDIECTAKAMRQAGFDQALYRNLFAGEKIGGGLAQVEIAMEPV